MSDPSALLAHIVSQTKSNIDFLVSQNHISEADGKDIIAKLPATEDHAVAAITRQAQQLTLARSEPSVPNANPPPAPNPAVPARRGIPPPPRRAVQVRALWNWNEHGENPNDLSFRAGDVIEMITETNADWWTGRRNGKQGLFPSNYVEKLETSSSPSPSYNERPPQDRKFSSPPYAPQYQQQHPMGPPPMGPPVYMSNQPVAYNPYLAQPPGNVVAQPPPEEPPKKSRFGGMGNTLAQSAVGGLGFGKSLVRLWEAVSSTQFS
ncbi:hypothetical protein PILCRDRAFT_817576, partial [Piloderma croceum F 1598]